MDRSKLVEFIFSPVEEFEWRKKDVVGVYLPGNTYNCSRLPVHDELRAKCAEWQEEGKIEVFPLQFGKSFIVVSPEGI